MNADSIKKMLRPSHDWDKHTLSQKICDRLVEFIVKQENDLTHAENRESMALEYAESLKNCANCRHIIWGDGELLCSKNWVGNKMEKCLHWQANHAGRD